MPITRTPIQDDSGSGQDGTVIDNAWKQELYNQIDALAGGGIGTVLGWTPTDASGAGLAFTVYGAAYQVVGQVVHVWLHLAYPATANGANAIIGGLPYAALATPPACGLYSSYGVGSRGHIPNGGTNVYLVNPTTSVFYTNSGLSGAAILMQGSYFR